MRITSLFAILLCLVIFACDSSQKEIPPPEKLLSKEEMASLLTDIHLAEAAISMSNINHHKALRRFGKYEQDIFKRHNIDSATYYKNYNYYMQNSKEMNHIYSAVNDSMLLRQARIKAEIQVRDSLKNLKDSLKNLKSVTTQPHNQSIR